MRKNKISIICLLATLCITLQAQPVYAEQITTTTETESDQTTPEPSDTPENPEISEEPEQPENPDAPENPEQPENPDLPIPKAVKNLHTTCKANTSVLIEWDASKNAVCYIVYRKQGKSSYKEIKKTNKTSYVDKTIKFGKKYRYKIVPVNADDQVGASSAITLNNRQAVNITSQKYSYTQMKTDMKELKAQYNDYCDMEIIGKSVNGRSIYDFSIGNPNAKKSLLVVSTLHAREYICSAVMMEEIQYYLRNYNKSIGGMTPAKVLQNMKIHYIVMANPDGVTISQTKSPHWKANGRGVDLNRNFPAKKFKVGGKKGAEGYTGPKALSEPETAAIAKLTKKLKKHNKLCGVVNYHAMGNIIYGDCSSKKINKDTRTMYKIAQKQTGYRPAGDSGEETPGGQYREYVMYMLHLPSITIEIGSTAAPCPYWQYNSAFQKNKLVVLKIAKAL